MVSFGKLEGVQGGDKELSCGYTENERGEPRMNLRLVAQAPERIKLPVTKEKV